MMTKVRILHAISGLYRGGAETFIMNVFRHIDRDKFMFDFLVNREGGDYEEEAKSLGAKIYRIPPRHEGFSSYRKNLDTFFSAHAKDYAAMHCHASSLTSIEVLEAARKHNIPVRIIHSHSSFPEGAIHRILHYVHQFSIGSYATHFLACSEKSRKWMYMMSAIRKNAIIIKNGIDVNQFRFDENVRETIRNRYDIGHNLLIGHVGRFHPIKNHTFLIDVFCKCLALRSDIRLMLVGEGETMNEIKSIVSSRGIEDKVIFTGLQTDTTPFYQAMDILLFPSIKEGLPLSLVEAQCTGLPILASDSIDSKTQILESFRFFSLKNSDEQWANELLRIMDATVSRSSSWMDVQAAGFDINNVVGILEKIYQA